MSRFAAAPKGGAVRGEPSIPPPPLYYSKSRGKVFFFSGALDVRTVFPKRGGKNKLICGTQLIDFLLLLLLLTARSTGFSSPLFAGCVHYLLFSSSPWRPRRPDEEGESLPFRSPPLPATSPLSSQALSSSSSSPASASSPRSPRLPASTATRARSATELTAW